MPLNYTVHDVPRAINGATPECPTLTPDNVANVVALGGISGAIVGPALLWLIADEDERIALSRSNVYAAPAATGIKLKAGINYPRLIPAGTFYLNVIAG